MVCINGAQIRLKLFLEMLEIPFDLSTIDGRKQIQKAVYIGKIAGFDLGYPFGWYSAGPYSPELRKDCERLSHALELGDTDYEGYELFPELLQVLTEIKGLMQPPCYVTLSQADWLELVASVLY